VQRLLKQAEHMTATEIHSLAIKPDWKKAMLFVQQMEQQETSQTNAELLADLMCVKPAPLNLFDIWQYHGSACWLLCNTSSIELRCGEYFLKNHNKIFCDHNWINLQKNKHASVMSNSKFVQKGTPLDLLQLKNQQRCLQQPLGLR
jgi:hypothetical protein